MAKERNKTNKLDGVRLTPHFTLEEMTHTNVMLGYLDRQWQTQPEEQVVENLTRVCQWLEMLRQRWNERYGEGDEPVIVTSGYRCMELNRTGGGMPYIEPPDGMRRRPAGLWQGTVAALRHAAARHQRRDAPGLRRAADGAQRPRLLAALRRSTQKQPQEDTSYQRHLKN